MRTFVGYFNSTCLMLLRCPTTTTVGGYTGYHLLFYVWILLQHTQPSLNMGRIATVLTLLTKPLLLLHDSACVH